MPKTKISEFSATPANNTDIDSINIAENCPPSGINDAIRELMAQLKDFQTGAVGDSFNGPVGTSTAAAGAFTTLGASSTATLNTLVSSGATLTGGTINGMTVGATTASTGAFTTLAASSTVTLSGGTANGVAYLNGSKVVTSGSALTFDGAILGVNGVSVGRGAGAVSTNTAVGASALASNTTGNNNTALGQTALTTNTTGNFNTAVGRQALFANLDGTDNSGFGLNALVGNTSGSYNTAIGRDALQANTTASNNTAVGYQAGVNNTTGTGNTYIGIQSGLSATSGSNNTFVGSYSGPVVSTSTGVGNTGLGQAAGASLTTGTYNTFVGPAGQINQGPGGLITTGSKNTILGGYNGNQNGLDIRTVSSVVVLSDGDGVPILNAQVGASVALQGAITKAGIGITFPATQVASSDANTLDDYEEGTWTPSFSTETGGTLTVTYTNQLGTYTRVGNTVTCRFLIGWSARSTSGSVLQVQGLPFNVSTANAMSGWVDSCNNITYLNRGGALGTQIVCGTYNGTFFSPNTFGNGTNTNDSRLDPTNLGASGNFGGTVVYVVA